MDYAPLAMCIISIYMGYGDTNRYISNLQILVIY